MQCPWLQHVSILKFTAAAEIDNEIDLWLLEINQNSNNHYA